VSEVTDIEAAGSETRSGRKVGPVTNSFIIRLKPGLSRDDAPNNMTVPGSCGMPGPARGVPQPDIRNVPQPDIRDVFARHSPAIYSSHEPLAEAGVVVTAIGPSGFEGSAVIAARPDLMNVITIGRHSNANLFLSQDPAMSLRQGAVIVYPHTNGEGVRFRILDLRAVRPFEDELGRQFEALEAEGPVFLRAGAYTLFVIPKEAGTPFCPETAWEDLAERIHLEEAVLGHRRVSRIPNRMAHAWDATVILRLPGPVFDHEQLLEDGENPQGMLVVRSAQGEMRLLLGRTAASRGVLLGRYPRCDGGEMGILCDPAISRVHALVIEIAGSLYALDAGSSNGLWIGSDRVRMARLVPGLMVSLAGGVGTIEWRLTP